MAKKLLLESLYQQVLVQPIQDGYTEISVVTGFASPAFARQILDISDETKLNLLVGMVGTVGISSIDHSGFCELKRELAKYQDRVQCYYYDGAKACHIKAVSVTSANGMRREFVGSANFTRNGFNENLELMLELSGNEVQELYRKLIRESVPCDSQVAEKFVLDTQDLFAIRRLRGIIEPQVSKIVESVDISLLNSDGEMHGPGGGLNHGQPTKGRRRGNSNEAYINVPAKVHKEHPDFFPKKGEWFQVETDDKERLWFSLRSGGGPKGKDLSTPESNAKLGYYLRKRLGIPEGGPFTKEHLVSYGRTFITISKATDDTFLLDFSKPKTK